MKANTKTAATEAAPPNTPAGWVRLNLLFPEDLHTALKVEAARRGCTLRALVQFAARELVRVAK